ncbi:MAG TPA: YggS family pyridoxal phosphate-dependent enzyme [Thermoanaerobaculia bacterium]|jgi:pyridoxal phosphate enzyme (YggS family)|nr:YggS family pyridoxal phosphate-dependent enzyme [Thermoanaerobaculia bacterium]
MSVVPVGEIAGRRESILEAIARAAAKAGRRADGVTLMAVTKGHGVETVRNAARAGLALFGENRVQEAAAKIAALGPEFAGLSWRLIGPLQTNKAKSALQWFAGVESLDRERLAVRLEGLLAEAPGGRTLPVLLEINLGGEASKSGVAPEEASRLLESALRCPHLDARGVMAVPPYDADPEKSRPHFRRLVETRDRLAAEFSRPLPEISMGMSHDFAVAVEEGATQVRVGTALFGPREVA